MVKKFLSVAARHCNCTRVLTSAGNELEIFTALRENGGQSENRLNATCFGNNHCIAIRAQQNISIHVQQNISKPHLPLLHQSHGMRKANLVGKKFKMALRMLLVSGES